MTRSSDGGLAAGPCPPGDCARAPTRPGPGGDLLDLAEGELLLRVHVLHCPRQAPRLDPHLPSFFVHVHLLRALVR